jgi:septin family protein
VGLEAAASHYADQLLSKAAGVEGGVAILFYGMGGIGKTTLALELFSKLSRIGEFSGRQYKVSIERKFGDITDYDALVREAQQELVRQVYNHRGVPANIHNMQECCGHLREALEQKQGPVLLSIDNVPEVGSGIDGMLPEVLLDILPKR